MRSLPPLSQVASNDPIIVLRVLQQQEATLSAELAGAKQQWNQAVARFESAAPADRVQAQAAVEQAAVQISETNRRLNMARDRVLDAERHAGILALRGVQTGQEVSRIFGLKPPEFYTLGFVLRFPEPTRESFFRSSADYGVG